MNIGVLCAASLEFDAVVERLKAVEEKSVLKRRFASVDISGNRYFIIQTGIAKANAAMSAQYLIDNFKLDLLLNLGTCGALKDKFEIGDVVVCQEIINHDLVSEMIIEGPPYTYEGIFKLPEDLRDKFVDSSTKTVRIVTGETFIDDGNRNDIINRYHPDVVDMETAAFAQVAFSNDVKFISIRAISDTPKESGLDVFYRNAQMVTMKATEYFLSKI